mgnify:CR=1 FL=1
MGQETGEASILPSNWAKLKKEQNFWLDHYSRPYFHVFSLFMIEF